MSLILQEFYMFPEEIYRMGNSGSHKLTFVRPTEVNTMDLHGVKVIIANGKGVSLYTIDKIIEKGLTGFAWQFQKGLNVTHGLKLVTDEPNHYMLAPIANMPVEKYKGLLEEMGLSCMKYFSVKEGGKLVRV
jgi:hypothetical protein